ncbi:hypothetical protein I4U23_031239 [Adineta vaga]|nr:hypothetical protein I4U23_031239 [Adineta vaga]
MNTQQHRGNYLSNIASSSYPLTQPLELISSDASTDFSDILPDFPSEDFLLNNDKDKQTLMDLKNQVNQMNVQMIELTKQVTEMRQLPMEFLPQRVSQNISETNINQTDLNRSANVSRRILNNDNQLNNNSQVALAPNNFLGRHGESLPSQLDENQQTTSSTKRFKTETDPAKIIEEIKRKFRDNTDGFHPSLYQLLDDNKTCQIVLSRSLSSDHNDNNFVDLKMMLLPQQTNKQGESRKERTTMKEIPTFPSGDLISPNCRCREGVTKYNLNRPNLFIWFSSDSTYTNQTIDRRSMNMNNTNPSTEVLYFNDNGECRCVSNWTKPQQDIYFTVCRPKWDEIQQNQLFPVFSFRQELSNNFRTVTCYIPGDNPRFRLFNMDANRFSVECDFVEKNGDDLSAALPIQGTQREVFNFMEGDKPNTNSQAISTTNMNQQNDDN